MGVFMLQMNKRTARLALVLGACVAWAACADDGETVDPDAVLEADVCEHFEQGPFGSATAGVDAASAADITGTHTRWDLTLADTGGGAFGGYATIAVDAAAAYRIYVNADVELAIRDATGAAVAATKKTGSDACPTIGASFVATLGVGTYTLAISAGSATTVQLVYLDPNAEEHE